jgi:hypothetical protein
MSRANAERRHAARIESLGQAFVMVDGGDTAIAYRVENLSSGGALLCDGPPIPWCETLQLVVRVAPLPPFECDARVVWRGDGDAPRYGVEFVSMDASAQDAIHDGVDAILAGRRDAHAAASGGPEWLG